MVSDKKAPCPLDQVNKLLSVSKGPSADAEHAVGIP